MLYYCKVPQGNFGDDLNPWLWSRLAPEVCDERDPVLFLGIGTILSHRVPREPIKVVLGAGWADSRPPVIDHRWFIYCVRGPVTASALQLDPKLAVVDPAILVRRVQLPQLKKCYPVSFMPHHWSLRQADWPALCARTGVHCINPRSGVEAVLADIQQTELLLAEAMHGAIVADALRVPWIPVRLSSGFNHDKWRDWTQSIQAPLTVGTVPPLFERAPSLRKRVIHACKKGLAGAGLGREDWRRLPTRVSTEGEICDALMALERLPKEHAPCLSADGILERAEARLLEKLAELRAAWPQHRFTPGVGDAS
jgi:succinoglycan biosynthesis protein ExoV